MLNHQLILTDTEGRLRCTLDVPTDFNGGTPTRDGLLCIAYVDPESFVNGLGYGPEIKVCAEQGIRPASDGPFVSDRGRLRTGVGSLPVEWLYGLPLSEDGYLCIILDEEPPVDTRAFSSAFSNAFK